MLFKNEYELTQGRYVKWAAPVFYKTKGFYVFLVFFIVGVYAYFYFGAHDVGARWQTLAVFACFMGVYRGVFYHYMAASKYYRVNKETICGSKNDWKVQINVMSEGVKKMENGKKTAYLSWGSVTSFQEAKSFYDIIGEKEAQIRLDKKSFTIGDAESFVKYMLEEHPEIPYCKVEAKYNV